MGDDDESDAEAGAQLVEQVGDGGGGSGVADRYRRPAGAAVASLLGDLADLLALPADEHYQRAAQIASQAEAPLWHERAQAHRPLLD